MLHIELLISMSHIIDSVFSLCCIELQARDQIKIFATSNHLVR